MKNAKILSRFIFYKLKSNKISIISLIFGIFLWHIVANIIANDIILPTPTETFLGIISLMSRDLFWPSLLHTVGRGLLAFFIIMLLGLTIAPLMYIWKILYKVIFPYIKLLQAFPVISWIILAVVWVNYNFVPVMVLVVTLLPIIVINVYEGLESIDPKILQLLKLYNINRIDRFKIYLGEIRPFIFSGAEIILGQIWKIAAVAELLGNPKYGIGVNLSWSLANLASVDTFAWTVIIMIISFVFNFVLGRFKFLGKRWKK